MKKLLTLLIVLALVGIAYAGGPFRRTFSTLSSVTNTSALSISEIADAGVCQFSQTGTDTKTLWLQRSLDGSVGYVNATSSAWSLNPNNSENSIQGFTNAAGLLWRLHGATNLGASNTVTGTCYFWRK